MNESPKKSGGKENSSGSNINVSSKHAKYPFVIPEKQNIVFTDLSHNFDYLMLSHMITSSTSESFVENTSPFFSSIETFEEGHISDHKLKEKQDPSKIDQFILRLYEAGVSSSFVQTHFFQMKLTSDEARGLLIHGCKTLPNFLSSEGSLKIVFCPESSLHFEKNFDFVLACFEIKKKEIVKPKRSLAASDRIDPLVLEEAFSLRSKQLSECVEMMKETISYLRPVILSLDEQTTKTAEFQLTDKYSQMLESNYKSPKNFEKLSTFKFDTAFNESEGVEDRKAKKLKSFCSIATVSARLVVSLYSDASKPDDVKHIARDALTKSLFDEILLPKE